MEISEGRSNDHSFQRLWYPGGLAWRITITTGLENLSSYKCVRVEGMNSQCEM